MKTFNFYATERYYWRTTFESSSAGLDVIPTLAALMLIELAISAKTGLFRTSLTNLTMI